MARESVHPTSALSIISKWGQNAQIFKLSFGVFATNLAVLVFWNHCVLFFARITKSSESRSMFELFTGGDVPTGGGTWNFRL